LELSEDSQLHFLFRKVLHRWGVDLKQYKINFVKRRIKIRLDANDLKNYIQYVSLLNRNPSEYFELFRTLSINVSEFFRDKDVFEILSRKIIPALLNEGNYSPIRIWCAGCATGEEPYSIAILLSEISKKHNFRFLRIIATDKSSKAIEFGKIGKYHNSALKNLPIFLLNKYFTPSEDKEYFQVSDKLKDLVDFEVSDIFSDPPPKEINAIFCRNLIIYVNRDMHSELFTKFHSSLKKRGYLVLGKSETIFSESSKLFKTISPPLRIFMKQEPSNPPLN